MKKTIKDIAAACGVSVSLVSRVINGDDTLRCRPETRDRILREVEAQRFVPDYRARSLANGSTQMRRTIRIGYVTYKSENRPANPYFDKIIEGIKTILTQQEYEVSGFYIDDVVSLQERKLPLAEKRLDGLILFGNITPKLIRYLSTQTKYLSSVYGTEIENADFVGSDMLVTMNLAVDYAVKLGYKHVGVLYGGDSLRDEALAAYIAKCGLETDEHFSFVCNNDYEKAYRTVSETLKRSQSYPRMLLCMNDEMAIGAMDAVFDCGLRVPDDISIIGHDDISRARYSRVPLTTVRIYKEEIGRIVSDLLLERILYQRRFHVKVFVPCELIVRKSAKKNKEQGNSHDA